MYLLLKTVVFHCSCWLTRGYTLFKNPSFWLHCHPLHFKGVYVIQSNLCQSQSLGASELRITNLGSLVQTQRSLVETPEDAERNKKSWSNFWNAWWMFLFFLFKGFMIHEGKEWMASHLWTDICPYVCFENLVIWVSPNKNQERFNFI